MPTTDRVVVVVIVGATGTGKSELSLNLAEHLGSGGRAAEIVNADAMQLYRGMDIGTAKVPFSERRGIAHHMLDVLDPTEDASVAAFQSDARQAIDAVLERGATPILVGGSGLYVSSVIFDFRFPGTDAVVRARLEQELAERGPGILFSRLRQLDEAAAAAIGPHNGRRIVRALEVIEITGEPFGGGLPDSGSWWRPAVIVGLTAPRETLVRRLDARVEHMWDSGLLDEVRVLRETGLGTTASRAIGYAQALAELEGRLSRAEAIAEASALTRRYARRQVGWFNRYADAQWFDHDAPDLLESVLERIGQD
jgi:tRNA dimethylallyltransferase